MLSWVRDHLLESPADHAQLAERLTAVGFNVELREPAPGGADDEVWDVDITTNRVDAMNHRGLAREAAAAGLGVLRPLTVEVVESDTPVGDQARVVVEDIDGCLRYCARVIRGVTVGPSPPWLAARLSACGVRPINNVVDATNYVLLDLGQPLHAFDLDRLGGREVRVRRATVGETLRTLDGGEHQLEGEDLVIADARRPIALAGIMGGADTEIRAETRDVLLESATFHPRRVRRTAHRLGLKTEASHRFERGADRAMARTAVDACAALIARVAGGEVAAGVLDSAPQALPAPQVTFSLAGLAAFAGCEVPAEFVLNVLQRLELSPVRDGDLVTCTLPPFRGDLELPEDLYEEILRHWGYDRLPSVLPPATGGPGRRLGSWLLTERARRALVALGAAEAITYSFVDRELEALTAASPLGQRGDAVPLINPLSSRSSVLRRSLLAGLVEAAAGNLRRGASSVLLGEVGRAFFSANAGVREEERAALVLAGEVGGWDERRSVDFFDLKGLLEGLLAACGARHPQWRPAACQLFADGEGAEVLLAGEVAAVAGRLGAAVAEKLDVATPLWVAEVDLSALGATAPATFRPLPRFPAVTADLTVRHDVKLTYDELVRAIEAAAPAWLEGVTPLVRYRGEGVGASEVKTTLRLTYRHDDRSLTQEEVNAAHFGVMERLAAGLGVRFD